MVLAGAAGVGKSRLARECAQRARTQGRDVGLVLATRAASGVPLGAFSGLLPTAGAIRAPRVDDLLRAAAQALRADGERERIVLVDDAQLLDDTSAALVLHLVTTKSAFVLATVRTGDPCPDAIASLWKESLGARLDLEPLGETQIAAVLEGALGGAVAGSTVRVLAHRCEGNMLFLTELVRGAREQGLLEREADAWRLTGPLAPSQRLAELVEARLGTLAGSERRALEFVALGEPLGLRELTAVSDESVLEALESRGLLAVVGSDRRTEVRLAHPLHGEVLRARLAPLRARSRARSLADAFNATGARRAADLLRIAVWRLDSGAPGDPELLADAAEIARARFDLALAERLALAALDAGGGFRPGLIAGEAAISLGRPAEAEERLAALVPLARTDAERGRLASVRILSFTLWLGRIDEATTIGAEAADAISDARWRAEVRGGTAVAMMTAGDIGGAIKLLGTVFAEPTDLPLPVASITAGMSYSSYGALHRALAWADRAERAETATTGRDALPAPPFMTYIVRCQALAHSGRIAEACAEAARGRAATRDAESLIGQAWLALVTARTLVVAGDVRAAAKHGREGLRMLPDHARNPTQGRYLTADTALALALCGQPDEARAVLDEGDRLAPWAGQRDVDRLVARAWVAVGTGRLREARATLLDAIDLAERQSSNTIGLVAAHDLARIGYPQDALNPIRQIAPRVDGELSVLRVEHVEALVDGEPARLLVVSEQFEQCGARLLAAEAAADAAVALARGHEPRRAAAAGRRAHRLADSCDNPRTPALAALAARAELTRAEREIATLAAAGNANREIAAQLVLSVRTIENTLRRVYFKLGISGRAQLAEALDRR
jgi:DNA-binding CsgD family transcriptional regulator